MEEIKTIDFFDIFIKNKCKGIKTENENLETGKLEINNMRGLIRTQNSQIVYISTIVNNITYFLTVLRRGELLLYWLPLIVDPTTTITDIVQPLDVRFYDQDTVNLPGFISQKFVMTGNNGSYTLFPTENKFLIGKSTFFVVNSITKAIVVNLAQTPQNFIQSWTIDVEEGFNVDNNIFAGLNYTIQPIIPNKVPANINSGAYLAPPDTSTLTNGLATKLAPLPPSLNYDILTFDNPDFEFIQIVQTNIPDPDQCNLVFQNDTRLVFNNDLRNTLTEFCNISNIQNCYFHTNNRDCVKKIEYEYCKTEENCGSKSTESKNGCLGKCPQGNICILGNEDFECIQTQQLAGLFAGVESGNNLFWYILVIGIIIFVILIIVFFVYYFSNSKKEPVEGPLYPEEYDKIYDE